MTKLIVANVTGCRYVGLVVDGMNVDVNQETCRAIERHLDLDGTVLVYILDDASRLQGPLDGRVRLLTDPTAEEDLIVALARSNVGDESAHGRGLHVLLAEDLRTNQIVMQDFLTARGHTFELVQDGCAALDALVHHCFDVAILDMHMPGMNGLEVVKSYGFAMLGKSAIPLIAVTADVSEETRAQCRAAGVTELLAKPVDFEKLVGVLEQVCPVPGVLGNRASHEGDETMTCVPGQTAILDDTVIDVLRAQLTQASSVVRVLKSSIVDVGELLDEILFSVERREYACTRQLLHALKGSAASVGAICVVRQADALFRATWGGNERELQAIAKGLRGATISAQAELSKLASSMIEQ